MDNIPGFDTLAQMDDKQLQALFGIRDFFVYELDFTALAAAGTATGSFTVQADSNFLWQYGAYYADKANDGTTVANQEVAGCTVTIQDQSSGRQLMSAAVPVPSIFGNGNLPFLLPTPRFFRAQTQVSVNIANITDAITYTRVMLQFIGTKFYKFPQSI